ncbi:hypothetical protein V8E36_001673 [Tilletia maclaganii]
MQLRLAFVAAALVLTTGAAAAALPQADGLAIRDPTDSLAHIAAPLEARLTKSQAESQAASITNTAAKQIKGNVAALKALQAKAKPTKAEANKAFAAINVHLKTAGSQYEALAKKYEGSSKRDPALAGLLNPVLGLVTSLTRGLGIELNGNSGQL